MGRDKFLQEVTILQALPTFDKKFSYIYSYVKDDREHFLCPLNNMKYRSMPFDDDYLENRKRNHRIFNLKEE
jgi:hypothetical protein